MSSFLRRLADFKDLVMLLNGIWPLSGHLGGMARPVSGYGVADLPELAWNKTRLI